MTTFYANNDIQPGAGGFQHFVRGGNGACGYFSLVETAGVACTVQLYGENGVKEEPIPLDANGQILLKRIFISNIEIVGDGAKLILWFASYEFPPQYLPSVAAATDVNIVTDSVGLAKDATLVTGNGIASNIWSKFPQGKVPIAANGGVLTGTS